MQNSDPRELTNLVSIWLQFGHQLRGSGTIHIWITERCRFATAAGSVVVGTDDGTGKVKAELLNTIKISTQGNVPSEMRGPLKLVTVFSLRLPPGYLLSRRVLRVVD